MRTRHLWPCMVCGKEYAELEGAELCEASHLRKPEPDAVRSSHQLERCDDHRDRPATHEIGSHMPAGDGSSGFTVARRLCAECYAAWKKKNIAFEYIR